MNSAFKHSAAAADRSLASPPAPFALFAGGHPLSPAIEALNRALRSRSDYRAMAGAPAQGRELRTLLRLRRDDKGDWRPRGAYLSFQRAAPERPYRFEACTFDYRYRDQRLSVVNFPHDPRLKALSPMLAQLTPYDAIEVLRYVPRLRATFTARHEETGALAVAKFAAPEETARSARALQALGRASGVERIGARLPALLGLDGRDRALLWQTRQPGVRLAGGITASNAAAAMERCGRMHARLHALSIAGLPCIGFDAVLAQTRMHADWLAFAGPAHREWFAPLPAALERLRPQEGERGFCHGDFRLTQILDDAGEWSLVDFDAACIADRCQEIG
ncbi:MAG: aminoglycoside phosphotransferase family protein, partial [Betaproteobacteria bacterium]|nr:aminoglycoside phosphotransferase family protein [Betaproteobacteria bacterium]